MFVKNIVLLSEESEESAGYHSISPPPAEVAMRLARVPMLQSDRVTSPMAAELQHGIITDHFFNEVF